MYLITLFQAFRYSHQATYAAMFHYNNFSIYLEFLTRSIKKHYSFVEEQNESPTCMSWQKNMRKKKSPKTPSFPGHPKRQELIFFFTNQNTPNAPSIQIPFSPHFMTEPSAELHLFSRIYHLSKIANITHKPLDFLSLKSPPSIPKDLCMLSIVCTNSQNNKVNFHSLKGWHSCQFHFGFHFNLTSKMKYFGRFKISVKCFGVTCWKNK